MRPALGLLLLLAALHTANGRPHDGLAHPQRRQRALQQTSSTCPIANCAPAACVYTSKTGLWRCTACLAPLVPNKAKAACVCPAGQFPNSAGSCSTCQRNFYCPLGISATTSTMTACPANMVTLSRGAKSVDACLNKPGYRYVKTANAAYAVACGANEYSAGLKKQTTCDQCPPNFVTDADSTVGSHTSSASCVAPPGYYLSGDRVAPCARGEFKEEYGSVTKCSSCEDVWGPGLTTAGEASVSESDCNQLEPGYALLSDDNKVITNMYNPATMKYVRAKLCPQNFFCPGGDPSLPTTDTGSGTPRSCPSGLKTEEEGAQEPSACKVPPGHSFTASSIAECPTGTYREGWAAIAEAQTCKPCGVTSTPPSWLSDRTVNIFSLDPDTGAVLKQQAVRGSPDSCFIQRGMGAVMQRDATTGGFVLQALMCPADFYGVATAKKYGLKATPCLACPPNMRTPTMGSDNTYRATSYLNGQTDTSTSSTTPFTGYFDARACATPAGYGYSGGSAQLCPLGSWGLGGAAVPCTQCGYGLTTENTATLKTSEAACNRLAPGFGFNAATLQIERCPIGTFSVGQQDISTKPPCTTCHGTTGFASTTTPSTGSTSKLNCTLCVAGYGAAAPLIGDCTKCVSGTYGPAGRTSTPCLACPADRSFAFSWPGGSEPFTPKPVSMPVSTSSDECFADFAQTVDGPFMLDVTGTQLLKYARISSLSGCVEECRSGTFASICVAVTFDYATNTCYLWQPLPAADWSTGGIAMKTFSSSTLVQSTRPNAKGMGVGVYTYWKTAAKDVMDNFLGTKLELGASTVAAPGSPTTLQACEDACTKDPFCAGVVFGSISGGLSNTLSTIGLSNIWSGGAPLTSLSLDYGAACYLILGSVNPANTRRTLVKAKVANMDPMYCPPGSYLASGVCTDCSGSGYSTDSGQTTCVSCTGSGYSLVNSRFPCGCPAGYIWRPDTGLCDYACTRQYKQWSEAGNRLTSCRPASDCPPGYVIQFDGELDSNRGIGCKKCPPGQVPNVDRTACGCAILHDGYGTFTARKTSTTATDGIYCTACTDGHFWAGPDVNTNLYCTSCNTATTGTSTGTATGQVRCLLLEAGFYYRAADDSVQPCPVGYYCGPAAREFNPANPVDQGITSCATIAAGVTTSGTKKTAPADCKVLKGSYFYCPLGASALSVGSPEVYSYICPGATATITDGTVIKCIQGAYCPGGGEITALASRTGISLCHAHLAGSWSVDGSVSDAACSLVAPFYYYSGSARVLCESNQNYYCKGGTTTTAARNGCARCAGTCDCDVFAPGADANNAFTSCKTRCTTGP